MKVILVSVGNFQEYVLDNIKNLLLHDNRDIVLITEPAFFNKLRLFPNVVLVDCADLETEQIAHYKTHSSIANRTFRNGFNLYCSCRLFYIYEYMKRHDLHNVVHIENDVMVYENLENLQGCFKEGGKVYAPFDTMSRVVPSFLYIPTYQSFEPIVRNYDYVMNDMENLARFGDDVIAPLPIFPIIEGDGTEGDGGVCDKFNKHYRDFNVLFDAAAIGQYLGGVDKRNTVVKDTRGFVNETCVVKYDKYEFRWIRDDTTHLYVPYVKIQNTLYKIINLHIHSKELCHFFSNYPIEQKFIPLSS